MQTRGLHRLRPRGACGSSESIPESEFRDDSTVAVDVRALHVIEKATTSANHFEKAATAVVILLVRPEVIVQIVDSLGEDRDLHASGARVLLRNPILLNSCGLIESHAVKSPPRRMRLVRQSDWMSQ